MMWIFLGEFWRDKSASSFSPRAVYPTPSISQNITIAQHVIAKAFRETILSRTYKPAQHITITQPVIAEALTTLPCFAQLYVPFQPPSEPVVSAALLR